MQFAGVLHKTFHTEEEMIIYSAQMSGFCREQEEKKESISGLSPGGAHTPKGRKPKACSWLSHFVPSPVAGIRALRGFNLCCLL